MASIYQIEPLGVVVPRSCEDAAAATAIHTAREWLSLAPVAEAVTDIGHDAPFIRISGQVEVGPNLDRP
jgi:hypothetical protein